MRLGWFRVKGTRGLGAPSGAFQSSGCPCALYRPRKGISELCSIASIDIHDRTPILATVAPAGRWWGMGP
jgi:hypothetical protein